MKIERRTTPAPVLVPLEDFTEQHGLTMIVEEHLGKQGPRFQAWLQLISAPSGWGNSEEEAIAAYTRMISGAGALHYDRMSINCRTILTPHLSYDPAR